MNDFSPIFTLFSRTLMLAAGLFVIYAAVTISFEEKSWLGKVGNFLDNFVRWLIWVIRFRNKDKK